MGACKLQVASLCVYKLAVSCDLRACELLAEQFASCELVPYQFLSCELQLNESMNCNLWLNQCASDCTSFEVRKWHKVKLVR